MGAEGGREDATICVPSRRFAMETVDTFRAGTAGVAAFHVVDFKCTNFRSYSVADFEPGCRLNCLVGPNGSGKTNILDALYYLAMCRSSQNLRDVRNIRHGEAAFAIFGKFSRIAAEPFTVSLSYVEGKAKEVQVDGEPLPKLADHIGRVPLVASYPSDTNIIDDGGELKRRFLNAAISQYDHQHLNDLLKYDRLLRQRNAYLKEGRCDAGLLDVLDAQIGACAAPIFKARTDFCDALRPLFQNYYSRLTDSQEQVDLQYRSQQQHGDLQQLLQGERENDRQVQHTTVGPHRDNLDFTLGNFPIRAEGSQGQRRSYMIALRLAQLHFLAQRTQTSPIFLLDDLFDRLDPARVQRLVRLVLGAPFGQVFITDTQTDRIAEALDYDTDEHCFFGVQDGEIGPIDI